MLYTVLVSSYFTGFTIFMWVRWMKHGFLDWSDIGLAAAWPLDIVKSTYDMITAKPEKIINLQDESEK